MMGGLRLPLNGFYDDLGISIIIISSSPPRDGPIRSATDKENGYYDDVTDVSISIRSIQEYKRLNDSSVLYPPNHPHFAVLLFLY